MKRSSEQYHKEYLARNKRSIERTGKTYGTERYQKEHPASQSNLEQLKELLAGAMSISDVDNHLKGSRARAYLRMVESKMFSREELDRLLNADENDFWPIYRDMYTKLVG